MLAEPPGQSCGAERRTCPKNEIWLPLFFDVMLNFSLQVTTPNLLVIIPDGEPLSNLALPVGLRKRGDNLYNLELIGRKLKVVRLLEHVKASIFAHRHDRYIHTLPSEILSHAKWPHRTSGIEWRKFKCNDDDLIHGLLDAMDLIEALDTTNKITPIP